jgi:hypothetical protein
MDVNRAFLQISSPAAASPSESASPRPQESKTPSAGGTKKSFASTLRTAQQREDKARIQQQDDTESRRAAKADMEIDQVKEAGKDAPRPAEINGRSLEAKEDQTPRNHMADSGDGKRKEGGEAQAGIVAVSAEVLGPLGQPVSVQTSPERPTDMLQASNDEEILSSLQKDGIPLVSDGRASHDIRNNESRVCVVSRGHGAGGEAKPSRIRCSPQGGNTRRLLCPAA